MIWYALGDPASGGRGVITQAVRLLENRISVDALDVEACTRGSWRITSVRARCWRRTPFAKLAASAWAAVGSATVSTGSSSTGPGSIPTPDVNGVIAGFASSPPTRHYESRSATSPRRGNSSSARSRPGDAGYKRADPSSGSQGKNVDSFERLPPDRPAHGSHCHKPVA
jgi:hypothetical protein